MCEQSRDGSREAGLGEPALHSDMGASDQHFTPKSWKETAKAAGGNERSGKSSVTQVVT